MRVGFVLSFLELTGGHIAAVEIANRLAARGHDVALVYPGRSIASRRNEALRRVSFLPDALTAPLYRMNGASLDWARFDGEIVRVPDLEERYMPSLDVVVATAWPTAERVGAFGSRTGRKVYFIQHYETWSGPAARVDATWRLPFVRIATSEWLARLGRERFGLDDVHVVPYGVDLDRFYPEPSERVDERLRLGILTHDEPWKGVGDALQAVRQVAEGGHEVRVVMFGAFPPPPDLPPGSEVRLRPPRDELRWLYSSLDVFLCASWSESGPMTVPEAMACETCVVSTDVGNVSLWTRGGEGGFLAPPRQPDELARVLTTALDEPEERTRRAGRGRELIQAFTWDRSADEFARIIEAAA
jgi:glycosyltransferase involved in cell wall biosynthesis